MAFDKSWNSGAVSFLNTWKNRITDLVDCHGGSLIDTATRKEWLKNSLAPSEPMTNSWNSWDTGHRLLEQQGGTVIQDPELAFVSLLEHLHTAAADYDIRHKITRGR